MLEINKPKSFSQPFTGCHLIMWSRANSSDSSQIVNIFVFRKKYSMVCLKKSKIEINPKIQKSVDCFI